VLVNNAGISGSAEQDFYSTEAWHRIMAVNPTGVFFLIKYAIPAMVANGGGSIVNLSSIAGIIGSEHVHMASKTVVRLMTKSVAVQHIRAWLFTIMLNQYANMVRRASREQATVDIEQMSSALVATTDPTASRQLRELERALGRLPGQQREVLPLVGLEGMSYETAAQILSMPVGTIRSLLSRGRDALRHLIDLREGPHLVTASGRERQPLVA
jgi:RNA polymerase sigma factor (sigma-70 family)